MTLTDQAITAAVEAEIEDCQLAALRWEGPFEVFTQIVWHEKRWKSPALRAFLETAREVFVKTVVENGLCSLTILRFRLGADSLLLTTPPDRRRSGVRARIRGPSGS